MLLYCVNNTIHLLNLCSYFLCFSQLPEHFTLKCYVEMRNLCAVTCCFLEVMARAFVCAPMSFLKNDVIVHICYSSFADLIIFPISVGKSRLFIHCVTLYVLL